MVLYFDKLDRLINSIKIYKRRLILMNKINVIES